MLEKISQGQFSKIITFLIIGTVFLTLPRRIALVAEWDSPISLIIGYGLAWLIGLIVVWISLNHPNETLIEYCKKIIGPYLGWIYCFLIFLVFMNLTILVIRLAGVTYIVTGYTNTPLIIFSGVTVVLAVWILKEGIEVLGRVIEVLYVPLIFSVIILFLSVSSEIEMDKLLPILAFGPEPLLNGVVIAFTIGVEHVFLVGILVSKVQKLDKKIYLAHLTGIFTGFSIIFLMVVAAIGVFTVNDVKRFYLPPYQLAKIVELGGFINGIEIILLGIWTIASVLEVTIFMYISVVFLSQLLNVHYRDIIVPLAYLFLAMSMAPIDNHQVEMEFNVITKFGLMPIVLALVFIIFPRQIYLNWRESTD